MIPAFTNALSYPDTTHISLTNSVPNNGFLTSAHLLGVHIEGALVFSWVLSYRWEKKHLLGDDWFADQADLGLSRAMAGGPFTVDISDLFTNHVLGILKQCFTQSLVI